MNINAVLIRSERLKRAWSQEHLAHVSGLGLRTVQRIESGGNASLETVKALAAVLELPTEALLAEASTQTSTLPVLSPSSSSYSSSFRLFKPWRAFAAGGVVTLIALGSFFNMQGAVAEQVALDFAATLNDEKVSISRLTSEDGTAAVVEISELLKINLIPRVKDGNLILLSAEVYMLEDGTSQLVSKPTILSQLGKPAMIRIKNEELFFELQITATIE